MQETGLGQTDGRDVSGRGAGEGIRLLPGFQPGASCFVEVGVDAK